MNVTTKTGDRGMTSIKNKRVAKTEEVIETLGILDELMASCIVTASEYPQHREMLEGITKQLSLISAIVSEYTAMDVFQKDILEQLEMKMKHLEQLEEFTFVYPFDCREAAVLNCLRTEARKAERSLWKLHEKRALSEPILQYANRLSDYFFLVTAAILKK